MTARRVRSLLRREAGQGVLELVVALALLLIVAAAAMSLLTSALRSERSTNARTEALVNVRGVVDQLTKEVRQALRVEMSSTRSRLAIRTLIGGVERDVVYEATGATLTRSVDGGTPAPVARSLSHTQLFCFDPPDCVLAAPENTKPPIVKVSVSLDPKLFAHGKTVAVTTDVHLRNAS